MSTFYVEQFEEKFKELINELHTKFPDNIEITVYFKSQDKLDYKKIAIHFATGLQNYSEFITKKNDNLFTNEDINFIDQIKFSELWTKIEESDKTVIWQYIQILYILSNIIADIPKTCVNDNNDETDINSSINDVVKTMKENFKTSDKQPIDLNSMSSDDINEATKHVTENLKSDNSGGNNIMMDMIGEINKELINITENPGEHKDESTEPPVNNPQLDMMSQMLNIDKKGLNGIMSIANKISSQFQSKVDSGELNPQDLMASAQSMLMNMHNIQK